MDTIKRWLGYGPSETIQPEQVVAKAIENTVSTAKEVAEKNAKQAATTVKETTEKVKDVAEDKMMKPVLSIGQSQETSVFDKFEAWTRTKLPLEPEDDINRKFGMTFVFTGYFAFLYYMLVHPRMTKQFKSQVLYKNATRVLLAIGRYLLIHLFKFLLFVNNFKLCFNVCKYNFNLQSEWVWFLKYIFIYNII